MIRVVNEIILGAVHRSPGICLTAEQNPTIPQIGNRLMKGQCDQSSPQIEDRITKHVRKGGEDGVTSSQCDY